MLFTSEVSENPTRKNLILGIASAIALGAGGASAYVYSQGGSGSSSSPTNSKSVCDLTERGVTDSDVEQLQTFDKLGEYSYQFVRGGEVDAVVRVKGSELSVALKERSSYKVTDVTARALYGQVYQSDNGELNPHSRVKVDGTETQIHTFNLGRIQQMCDGKNQVQLGVAVNGSSTPTDQWQITVTVDGQNQWQFDDVPPGEDLNVGSLTTKSKTHTNLKNAIGF